MKVGVENYWRFNGIKTPSVKARTKVLASFEAGMNSPNLPWHVRKHYITETQKPIRRSPLLSPNHSSNHGLKADLYVSFFGR